MNMAWSSIVLISLSIYFLWVKLKIAAFAGVLLMAIIVPITSYLTNKNQSLQVKKLKHQDARIRIINEMLNGMKVQ
jgi:hypothetical protein